jgi:hypothetical protein
MLDRLDVPPPPSVDGWAGADIWDIAEFTEVNWEGVGDTVKGGQRGSVEAGA